MRILNMLLCFLFIMFFYLISLGVKLAITSPIQTCNLVLIATGATALVMYYGIIKPVFNIYKKSWKKTSLSNSLTTPSVFIPLEFFNSVIIF
jgi:hypothetical protein